MRRHPGYRFGATRAGGAAIVTVLLVVTLVSVVVSGLFWRQHVIVRSVENRLALAQARWIERAALDWARVILRDDIRRGNVDHHGEPWAVPVAETRLDETVTGGARIGTASEQAFLAGRIFDAQGLFNINNLVAEGAPDDVEFQGFRRLLELLGQPVGLSDNLLTYLIEAAPREVDGRTVPASVLPLKRVADLLNVPGFDPSAVAALEPFVTVLPERTRVNLNTAPAEVLAARLPADRVDLSKARSLVIAREARAFASVGDAAREIDPQLTLPADLWDVKSSFFVVRGVIRYDRVEGRSDTLLRRQGTRVEVVWQDRY